MPTQSQAQSDQPKMGKSGRGFAAMDQAKQREIASKGGKAAHESGRAHEFTSEEARAAGRKGGEAAHESGRAHEFTSEEARAAGRKGGEASHANRLTRAAANNNATNPANGNVSREPRPNLESVPRTPPVVQPNMSREGLPPPPREAMHQAAPPAPRNPLNQGVSPSPLRDTDLDDEE
jgi:general stress protein YciG